MSKLDPTTELESKLREMEEHFAVAWRLSSRDTEHHGGKPKTPEGGFLQKILKIFGTRAK